MTEQAQAAPGGQEAQEAPAEKTEQARPPEGAAAEPPKTYDQAYVDELRKENAKARTTNKSLEKQVEEARKAGMSEAEKAISEAEERGRSTTRMEYGKRLARTSFDAHAGRRNSEFDTAQVLELVDMTKLVGEDGEPNEKAIAEAVERLVPEAQAPGSRPPSFDSGTRTTAKPSDSFSDTLRRQLGR